MWFSLVSVQKGSAFGERTHLPILSREYGNTVIRIRFPHCLLRASKYRVHRVHRTFGDVYWVCIWGDHESHSECRVTSRRLGVLA